MYMAGGTIRHEIARRFHSLSCHQQWNVGIVNDPIHVFLEPDARPRVSWLPPLGKGSYIADPFGIERGGEVYVFFEEFSYSSNKGVISWIRISQDAIPSDGGVAINMPFHLSHPFLFESEGAVYCVPESFRAKEVGLYRANHFPNHWQKVGTLIPNFAGVDPTIFFHQWRWWMMCTDADTGPDDSLFIWYAEEPRGPWRPHPSNPLIRGRNGTRPAGTPFVRHGDLYRPAMDLTRTYGRRIVLNRVKRLTPTEFEEEPAGIIEPFPHGHYRDGVHTLSALGNMTLVDGLRVTFERVEFERALEAQRLELFGWLSRHLHTSG